MSLGDYLLKRLLLVIPVYLGITIVVFLLIKITPGSPISVLLPPTARTPTQIAQLTERLGLDQPIHVQYVTWLFHALQGDLGRSYATRQPVTEMVLNHVWPTVQLTIVALLISLIISIPVGILSAVYKDTWIDHTGRVVAFGGISVPSF